MEVLGKADLFLSWSRYLSLFGAIEWLNESLREFHRG